LKYRYLRITTPTPSGAVRSALAWHREFICASKQGDSGCNRCRWVNGDTKSVAVAGAREGKEREREARRGGGLLRPAGKES